jgi:WD40 repeat protein
MQSRQLKKLKSRLYASFPVLGGWLQSRAARSLARETSPAAIQILAEALEAHPNPGVRQIARRAIASLKKGRCVDTVCEVWMHTRSAWLGELIGKRRWVATAPLQARVYSALQCQHTAVLINMEAEGVPALLKACQDGDAQIANLAQQAAAELKEQAARQAVCQAVIDRNDPQARRAADLGGFLPEDLRQRAIYLFITERWDAYQALDFDHRLLRMAYEASEAELRRRILETMRAAGRSDLLAVITGRDQHNRLAVLAADEANFIVQMLAENKEWAALWNKALELPPAASQRSLQILTQNGWRPPSSDENRLYEALAALTADPFQIMPEAARRQLPPALQRARARVVSTRINDLAFAPTRPILALGTSGRKVALWNFQHGEREKLLDRAFSHAISKVAFTRNGDLLFAERTNGRASCSVYLLQEGRTQQIWKQWGSITALAPVGESQILLAGRDHQVAILDPGAEQALTHSRTFPFWARDAAVSGDGGQAALVYAGATLIRLPDLEPLLHLSNGLSHVARVAAFTPDDQALLLGRYNGEVRVLNFGKRTLERKPLARHGERVEGIACLQRQGITITSSAEGGVHFMNWADRASVGNIQAAEGKITSLRVSPDEAFMALGSADATISLWDLRPLEVPNLFNRPLALATPNHLAALGLLIDQPQIPVELRHTMPYIESVLRFRFRFDVEVSAAPEILPGEFEIELG